jgi:hypothetical protein
MIYNWSGGKRPPRRSWREEGSFVKVEPEVLRLSMETTPKLESPLLVGTPMNYAFAFAVNYCVCGFDAN